MRPISSKVCIGVHLAESYTIACAFVANYQRKHRVCRWIYTVAFYGEGTIVRHVTLKKYLEESEVADEAVVGAGGVGGLEEVCVPLGDVVGVRVVQLAQLQYIVWTYDWDRTGA